MTELLLTVLYVFNAAAIGYAAYCYSEKYATWKRVVLVPTLAILSPVLVPFAALSLAKDYQRKAREEHV